MSSDSRRVRGQVNNSGEPVAPAGLCRSTVAPLSRPLTDTAVVVRLVILQCDFN